MTQISPQEIRDLTLFGPKGNLELCKEHQDHLSSQIAPDLTNLVNTVFFQELSTKLLKINPSISHFHLQMEKQSLIVFSLQGENGQLVEVAKNIINLDSRAEQDVIAINNTVIAKANVAFRRCQNENSRDSSSTDHHSYSDLRHSHSSNLHSRRSSQDSHATPRSSRRGSTSSEEDVRRVITTLRREKSDLESRTNPSSHKIAELEAQIRDLSAKVEELERLKIDQARLESRLTALSQDHAALIERATAAAKPSISDEDFKKLIQLADDFEKDSENTEIPEGLEKAFDSFPQEIRNAVYFQAYLLSNPLDDCWECGESSFHNKGDLSTTNHMRAASIHRFLLQQIAFDFARARTDEPSNDLLTRFKSLPEADRWEIFRQCQYCLPKKFPDDSAAGKEFVNSASTIVDNQTRHQSILRHLQTSIRKLYNEQFIPSIQNEMQQRITELETELREMQAAAELGTDQALHIISEQQEKFLLALAEKEAALAKLNNQLRIANTDAQKLSKQKDTIDETRRQLAQVNQENQELRANYQELDTEHERLKDAQQGLVSQVQALRQQIATLESQTRADENALRELQTEIETLKTKNKTLVAARNAKTDDLQVLQQDRDSLITERDTLQKKMEQLQRLNTQLNAGKIDSDKALSAAELEFNAQKDQFQNQKIVLDKRLRMLEEQLKEKESELAGLNEDLNDSERAKNDQERRLRQLEKDLRQIQEEKNTLNDELLNARKEIHQLNESLREAPATIGDQRKQIEALQQKERDLLSQLNESRPTLISPSLSDSNDEASQPIEILQGFKRIEKALENEVLSFTLDTATREALQLNRFLAQVETISAHSKDNLKVSISQELAQELNIPSTFTLINASTAERALGTEFSLQQRNAFQTNASAKRFIKALQEIRGDIVKRAPHSHDNTTPWRAWKDVFLRFNKFCEELNTQLPELEQTIAAYKETNTQESRQKMLDKYQEVFLSSLPKKSPMKFIWKMEALLKTLPEATLENESEQNALAPFLHILPKFRRNFSQILRRFSSEGATV